MNSVDLNRGWQLDIEGKTLSVDLPHTWNALDGQSGENGYLRTRGTYSKKLPAEKAACCLKIGAANSRSAVRLNGETLAVHEGGYSAIFVPLTGKLSREENLLEIDADNSPDESIYPTMADFTFYGGLYRGVELLTFPEKHFDVTLNGSGVFVTPAKQKDGWLAEVTFVTVGTLPGDKVTLTLADAEGNAVASATVTAESGKATLPVSSPRLWDVDDPYLYTLTAEIAGGDSVSVETGFRTVAFDADKGFFLNGRHLKIKGVSRHQDRENMGNALTPAEHEEDIRLIKEVGANSVRLAHYQHSDYFYTLCDRAGLLVWAEVPVISRFSKKRQQNALSQLRELILQSKNHPSIFTWSIANEITIAGESRGLEKALRELNDLAHSLDPTRPTAMAAVTMCPAASPLNSITDILGYNHYYGWYVGVFTDLDKWLANWRKVAPDKKLCLSEYGAEGILRYQGASPVPGDYSEGYQAIFHENYIERINAAEWMWGSYVWNMFDFGSAARNEGGVRGRNNKGLVTFDRKIKKDAFFLYKAYWSDEPFVHMAGARYLKRLIGTTEIKVYSNLSEVEIEVNGEKRVLSGKAVFRFKDVPVKPGDNTVVVRAGGLEERAVIEGVETEPEEYRLPEGAGSFVRNWFASGTDEIDPTRFSTEDKVRDLVANPEVQVLIKKFVGNKVPRFLISLVKPFRVKTLLKLPFAGLDEQMISMVDRYLQTIKK